MWSNLCFRTALLVVRGRGRPSCGTESHWDRGTVTQGMGGAGCFSAGTWREVDTHKKLEVSWGGIGDRLDVQS